MCCLFISCPAKESPVISELPVRVQGHVYDNETKQPLTDCYVGLYQQRRAETGLPTLERVVDTRTDNDGFYSLQGSVISEACKAGSAKLFLMPLSSDNGTGTRIACTETLQTIDLYK